MKISYALFIIVFLESINFANVHDESHLSITNSSTEIIIAAQPEFHKSFGLAFPITYIVDLPIGSEELKVWERHTISENWMNLIEKNSLDTFNDIEAVRFDYTNSIAFISSGFSGISDSIYLKVTDKDNNLISITYKGIAKYYDNREAAVTITFDDYADWTSSMISPLTNLFRSYGLYMTAGVITSAQNTTSSTWQQIQQEVNKGNIEVASHSRNHPPTPYGRSAVNEIEGSYKDIIDNLTLPPLYNINNKEYVYTWIAPYGDYDEIVDSLLGVTGYLTARLYKNLPLDDPREYIYGDSTFSQWDINRNHFEPFFPSVELGAPSWGGGDTSIISLNNLFDTIVSKGGIYHLMWHPQVLFPDIDKDYLNKHLTYISGHKNIWYVCLGNLYLYHLIQSQNIEGNATSILAGNSSKGPANFNLMQNYPNPFNPATKIKFIVPERNHIIIKVFNILGKEVSEIINSDYEPGKYEITFNGENLSSGVYFCRMQGGKYTKTIKLVLQK